MSAHTNIKMKITTQALIGMKKQGEKIAMPAAYDNTTARILDGAGLDVVLADGSAANDMAGYESAPLPIFTGT